MGVRVLLPVLVVLFLFASPAAAQFDTGHVAGFVRDTSNAPIPGATVTVQNEGNRDRRVAVSDGTGYYAFPDLPVGSYSVTVELAGFKRFVKSAVKLSSAARLSVDATLELGNLEETVEVRASESTVQTNTAQVARTVDSRQIQDLTLNGRNPIFLALLKPGVRGGLMGAFSPDSLTNGNFRINGAPDGEYEGRVDRARAPRTRSSGATPCPPDVKTLVGAQSLAAY